MSTLQVRLEGFEMHPTLITMYANAQMDALRQAAETRRRYSGTRARRGFTLRVPRRVARLAHV